MYHFFLPPLVIVSVRGKQYGLGFRWR